MFISKIIISKNVTIKLIISRIYIFISKIFKSKITFMTNVLFGLSDTQIICFTSVHPPTRLQAFPHSFPNICITQTNKQTNKQHLCINTSNNILGTSEKRQHDSFYHRKWCRFHRDLYLLESRNPFGAVCLAVTFFWPRRQ